MKLFKIDARTPDPKALSLAYAKEGLLFGSTYMLLFHMWMLELDAFAPLPGVIAIWIAFSLYLSLFYGATLWLFARFKEKGHPLLGFISVWVVLEWVRQLGPIGNPAGTLGYGLANVLPVAQSAKLISLWGLSALVLACNMLVASTLGKQHRRRDWISYTVFMITCLTYGYVHLTIASPHTAGPTLSLIQGNHKQVDKLNHDKSYDLILDYVKLSQDSKTSTLIIWPETVTPRLNLDHSPYRHAISTVTKAHQQHLLLGTPIRENDQLYNAIAHQHGSNAPTTVYRKQKLMPFGEYWPFRTVMSKLGFKNWLDTLDFSAGQQSPPLQLGQAKIGLGICLESIYPQIFRTQVKAGATLFVTLANNAWFFESSAAEKHLQMTQLRAIENHRQVIQVANTGYTALFDANGRPEAISSLDKVAIISADSKLYTQRTLYTRVGPFIIPLALIYLLAIDLRYRRKKT